MAFGYVNTRTIECLKMSTPLVFKFGGASVKDADGVKNLAHVLSKVGYNNTLIVVSAMGKTTNALEAIMQSFANGDQKDARRQVDALYIFLVNQ